jgi:IS30 family transposase
LEELLMAGHARAAAARLLGRDRSTISREARRGATGWGYRARVGQDAADASRARPKPRKLQTNPVLLEEVLQRLKQRHSPEQVAGRLREDFPNDAEMWVSHETIYQAMYVQPRGELARQVKTALRTGRASRKPQGRNPIDTHGRIKDMINISERPAEADDRAIAGHWEGDLIIGAHGESAIGTLVERTTGFVMLLHLPGDRTAATVAEAITAKIPEIPEILRRSLTWDQGSEMALHTQITAATGLPIYFCDPHTPWQRGTSENTNGLLRQYFPKGTDLSFHGPGILDNVAAELNARPRKRHNWRTPAEELDRLLSDPSAFVAATA